MTSIVNGDVNYAADKSYGLLGEGGLGAAKIAPDRVTRYTALQPAKESVEMSAPAERMRTMRERRRRRGLREVRLVVPDTRSPSVRRRVAAQVSRLVPAREDEALSWIEAVSEFDGPDRPAGNATR